MITIYLLITITTAFIAIALFDLCNDRFMKIVISLIFGAIAGMLSLGCVKWHDNMVNNARIKNLMSAEIIRKEEADKYQAQIEGGRPLRINGKGYKNCQRIR